MSFVDKAEQPTYVSFVKS